MIKVYKGYKAQHGLKESVWISAYHGLKENIEIYIKEGFNLNTKFISMFNTKNAAKLYDVQINFKDIASDKNILENLVSSARIDIDYIFLSNLIEKLELKKNKSSCI